MRVGVPKEIKVHEYRVGLTPASVAELVAAGHEVVVETKAGSGIDCPDKAYEKAGAQILPDAPSVFKAADMIVKVKEPQPQEIALLEPPLERHAREAPGLDQRQHVAPRHQEGGALDVELGGLGHAWGTSSTGRHPS